MLLKRYSIYQFSARTLLSEATKTEDGFKFHFDIEAASNSHAMPLQTHTHTIMITETAPSFLLIYWYGAIVLQQEIFQPRRMESFLMIQVLRLT